MHDNPFLESPENLMLLWKRLREEELPNLSEKKQLILTTKWVEQTPLVQFSIDFDNPTKWPSPWELLDGGRICESARSYLIEQTLWLMPDSPWHGRTKLVILKDNKHSFIRMCTIIDKKIVLNHTFGKPILWKNIGNHCDIQVVYEYDGTVHTLSSL